MFRIGTGGGPCLLTSMKHGTWWWWWIHHLVFPSSIVQIFCYWFVSTSVLVGEKNPTAIWVRNLSLGLEFRTSSVLQSSRKERSNFWWTLRTGKMRWVGAQSLQTHSPIDLKQLETIQEFYTLDSELKDAQQRQLMVSVAVKTLNTISSVCNFGIDAVCAPGLVLVWRSNYLKCPCLLLDITAIPDWGNKL